MPYIVPPDEQTDIDQFGRIIRASGAAAPVPPAPMVPAPSMNVPAPTYPGPSQAQPTVPIPPPPGPSPVAAMPREQQLENALPIPDPNDIKYHQSRLRTVLNAIGAGLAGAAGGPKAGIETAESLKYGAYNRDVQRAQTQRELLKPQVASEVERRRAGEESTRLETGAETAKSLAKQRTEKEELEREKIRQQQERINQAHEKQNDLVQYRKDMEALKKYIADKKTDPITIANWLDGAGPGDEELTPEERDIVKKRRHDLWVEEKARQTEAEAGALTTAREEAKAEVAVSPLGQQAAAVTSGARAGAAEKARETVQQELVTPEIEAQYKAAIKTDPTTAGEIIKNLPAAAKAKLMADSVPKKLTARSEERLVNAKITLAHADSAIKMATDPEIARLLGPISGRIQIIKGKVGSGNPDYLDYDKAIANLKPDEARKMGEFLNFLNYMIVWESTTLSGTRPAQRLIEQLITTGARASMSQDRLLGALDAVKRSVGNTIGTILPSAGAGATRSGETDKKKGGVDWSKAKVGPG
jgi:hypothetical protein